MVHVYVLMYVNVCMCMYVCTLHVCVFVCTVMHSYLGVWSCLCCPTPHTRVEAAERRESERKREEEKATLKKLHKIIEKEKRKKTKRTKHKKK